MPNISSTRRRASARGDLGVEADRLLHLGADGGDRIEARHRLLEDHADLAAAQRCASPAPAARAGRGRRSGCGSSGSMRPGRGTRRMMASAVMDLPQPGFAHQRQRLARRDRQSRRDRPRARGPTSDGNEMARRSIASRGRAHWPSLRVRGSAMSRMASAIRLTASTRANSRTEAPARFHQMIGRARELVAGLVDHLAPAAVEPDAEIGQDRLRQHQPGEGQREGDDDEVGEIGQDVAHDDAACRTRRARGRHRRSRPRAA